MFVFLTVFKIMVQENNIVPGKRTVGKGWIGDAILSSVPGGSYTQFVVSPAG